MPMRAHRVAHTFMRAHRAVHWNLLTVTRWPCPQLLERIGAPTELSTLVLIQGDKFYTRSDAALRTLALMDWPYRALSALWIIPYPLRDLGYVAVAKVRYKVFGKRDSCRVPTGDFRRRFIDYRAEEEGDVDPVSGIAS